MLCVVVRKEIGNLSTDNGNGDVNTVKETDHIHTRGGLSVGNWRQTDNTSKFEKWSGLNFGYTIRLNLTMCFSVNFDGF